MVHRARDLRTRRVVAAKVLGPGARPEPALTLDHPHVLVPHDRVVGVGVVVLASDLVRGGSLAALAREHGALAPGWVAAVLAQLLDALAAVHAAGLVHGDVKPANLLLEPTGTGRPHLRLSDFGVAAPVGHRRAGPVGTLGYAAPECRVAGPADPASDVHAAAVTARVLLDDAGALTTLLDSMRREPPERRPSAVEAAARLRELPLPRGGRWPVVPRRWA